MERSTVCNVQAIQRSFSVLREMAAIGGQSTVGQVARATGLPKSTVSRLMAALEEVGVVERLDGAAGTYAIGPGLAALSGNVSVIGAVRQLLRPHLLDLTQATGEAAGVAVSDGPTNTLYSDHVESPRAVVTRDWSGARFPYHTVAAGFAILGTWTDEEIAAYVDRGLEKFTPATETTLFGVMKRVRSSRSDGYVWTLKDFSDEINGVAAPILDGTGKAIAAISIYGPSFRFPGDQDRDKIGALVREHAAAASRNLQGA